MFFLLIIFVNESMFDDIITATVAYFVLIWKCLFMIRGDIHPTECPVTGASTLHLVYEVTWSLRAPLY